MKDLKPYLERLNNGEALEAVQADFVKDFADVSAAEIVAGEEALIAEGADPNQLTRLCDVHSAMFHGDQNEEELPSPMRSESATRLGITISSPLRNRTKTQSS